MARERRFRLDTGEVVTNAPRAISEPITSEQLTEGVDILPSEPIPEIEAPALEGQLAAFGEQEQSFLERERERVDQIAQARTDSLSDLVNAQLGQTGLESFRVQQEEQLGVPDLKTELSRVNNELLQEQRGLELQLRELDKNKEGLFGGALQDRKAAVRRVSLQRQADLAIVQMAAQGRFDSAQALADRRANMLFEREENEIEALQTIFDENKSLFNKREERLFDAMLSERNTNLENAREDEKELRAAKFNTMQVAQLNNAPVEVLRAIQAATSLEEVAQAGGRFGAGDLLARQKTALEIEKTQREIEQINETYSGEFSNVVDAASNLVGSERGKTSRKAIGDALSSGDYASAYALVANNVEESLTADNKSKFANARTDYSVMIGMRDAVQAYADAGGDLGFLKGTADKIARKLGQLKSDPEFATLAVELEREFQAYRQNMTGAAFSEAESAEYAAVNPRTTASLDLNVATIDGALNQLERRITSTINTRVPGASDLYDVLTGNAETDVDPETAEIGSIIEYEGVRYRKVGDNQYEEI